MIINTVTTFSEENQSVSRETHFLALKLPSNNFLKWLLLSKTKKGFLFVSAYKINGINGKDGGVSTRLSMPAIY